jgi:nucleotide-binding universal stress UspA family protein
MTVAPIVVGTDGSPTASRAVRKAGELARALGAPVHIVTCYEQLTGGAMMAAAGGIAVGPFVADEDEQNHAQDIASQAVAACGEVEAHTHVHPGEPAEALIEVADSVGAQMIVVGNRGMSGARRVLGSVPNRVSHRAHCSVLIVHTKAPAPTTEAPAQQEAV